VSSGDNAEAVIVSNRRMNLSTSRRLSDVWVAPQALSI